MKTTMNRREILGALAAVTTTGVAPVVAQETTGHSTDKTGPRNLITDVEGLQVGQAQNDIIRTGVTVILPDTPAVAAVDVRGGGPASRETDVLKAENLVQEVDAIVLSGGSVYGLASADGIAAWMGAQNRGFKFRPMPGIPPSPILPTACLYDLANGGDKAWGESPPYRELGIEAVESVSKEVALGTAGAGYGANAGGLKGGMGSASAVSNAGFTVGAIAAVNSLGSAVAPDTKQFWAAPFEIGNEFGGLGTSELKGEPEIYRGNERPRENTTLACIATDVAMSRVELERVAIMASDGMARALRPSHAPFDGDIVFALSTGKRESEGVPRPVLTLQIGSLAADVLARAIARGVYAATAFTGGGNPAWQDI